MNHGIKRRTNKKN